MSKEQKPLQISEDLLVRFEFGQNWLNFRKVINEQRLKSAQDSLTTMLDIDDLAGRTFLDIGCGSGLFSLAANTLGATVTSFDYDNNSVVCTKDLRDEYKVSSKSWQILKGSALDLSLSRTLGEFDIVYSWGVLHHTGDMYSALHNASKFCKSGGVLFIAIYNCQGWISSYWLTVKNIYNWGPIGKLLMTVLHMPYLFFGRFMIRLFSGRGNLERGMSLWFDMHDWLGGLPFEVATPEQINSVYKSLGFSLIKQNTCGSKHGCNEFVFIRT